MCWARDRESKEPQPWRIAHYADRMYPIVPPPADVSADVNLDISHHELLGLDVAPDVLILPSRLKYFAKVSHLRPPPDRYR